MSLARPRPRRSPPGVPRRPHLPAPGLRRMRIPAGLRQLLGPGSGRPRSALRSLSQLPDAARPGGSGGQRAEAARRVAELECSSPAASFGQATKSWPLSGSGLKFSREVEAGICSAPCEMAGGGQRARGCGFVAANHSRRLCSLHKITWAKTPSQALFPTLLGPKARGFTGRKRQTNLAPASIKNLPSRWEMLKGKADCEKPTAEFLKTGIANRTRHFPQIR